MTDSIVQPSGGHRERQHTVTCPPDKSLTHRAIMFAAMAHGRSDISRPLLGEDCLATATIFRQLGVTVELDTTAARITVQSDGWQAWQSPDVDLDCGNSGTTARLLLGVFAASAGLQVRMVGDASLSTRPMLRVVAPLRAMGADISGAQDGNVLPLSVCGQTLQASSHKVDKASAQIKSALLLAGMRVAGATSVTLPSGSRDHTERLLEKLGAQVRVEQQDGQETVCLTGPFQPAPINLCVPGDPSSAAFFAVHAALHPGLTLDIEDVLSNETRCGFLTVLKSMGADLTTTPGKSQDEFMEPVYRLRTVGGGSLTGTEVPHNLIPTCIDEVPILAVAAAFAKGSTIFRGVGELRVKESDRLEATMELLTSAGAQVSCEADDLHIAGGLTDATPFRFDARGDHRLAMAAAILAKRASGDCVIEGTDCVAVSLPGFFDLLAGLG